MHKDKRIECAVAFLAHRVSLCRLHRAAGHCGCVILRRASSFSSNHTPPLSVCSTNTARPSYLFFIPRLYHSYPLSISPRRLRSPPTHIVLAVSARNVPALRKLDSASLNLTINKEDATIIDHTYLISSENFRMLRMNNFWYERLSNGRSISRDACDVWK